MPTKCEYKNLRQWDRHASTHADLRTSTRHAISRTAHLYSVRFTSAHLYGNIYMPVGVARALAHSSDFGLRRSKVHINGRFPAWDADEPPCKICRR